MKKLIIVCMLAAIGAVTMIDKSYAAMGDGACGPNPYCGYNGGVQNHRQPNPRIPGNTWQGQHHWSGQPNPNWQSNNNGQWWLNHHHHHHNFNGGAPFIGFGVYGGPSYDDQYYNDSYGYAEPDPYSYRSYSGASRCDAWAQRLRSAGYRNVHATDCVGTSFVYRATKAGRPVKVTVRASSGSIIRVASAY